MPSLDIYRQQATAQNELRVVRNARPSEAASEVVGETITAAGELGIRIQEARAEQEAVNLEIEAKRRYDALYRELETDGEGDYSEFEKRLTEGSAKLRGELTGKVRSRAVRDAFDQRLQGIEGSYIVRTRDLMQRRGVEEVKGGLIGRLASLEDTANDMSVLYEDKENPETRTFTGERDVVMAEIRSLRAKGFIGKDEEAAYKAKIDDLSQKADSDRIVKEVSDRLDAGETAAAEEYFKMNYGRVSPAQRDAVEKVIESKGLEYRAITKADQFWSASGGDYGTAITEAYKIQNPDERLAVESRLAQLKNQGDAAKAAADQALLEEGMGFIVEGRSLPSDLLRRASPMVIDRLQTEQRTRALWAQQMATSAAEQKAAMREISMGNYRILKAQMVSDPEVARLGVEGILADPNLSRLWEGMSPDERGQFVLDAANAKGSGGAPADAVSKSYKSVVNLASAYMPENLSPKDYAKQFSGVGEGDPGVAYISANRKKPEAAMVFEGELMRLVDEEMARTGGADIQADRAKQLVALAYAKAGEKKDGTTKYPIPQDIAAGAVQTDMRRIALDYRQKNPAIWREATTLVRSQYPNASDELVLEEARRIEQRLTTIRSGRGELGRFPME